MSAARPDQAGFTLVEMLVALSIFSLAAVALLRLGGTTAMNGAAIEEHALAQIVARNIAAETLTDPAPPPFGELSGEIVNGGRSWHWTRTTARSPEARIQQIAILVRGERASAQLTIFRKAAA